MTDELAYCRGITMFLPRPGLTVSHLIEHRATPMRPLGTRYSTWKKPGVESRSASSSLLEDANWDAGNRA